MKIQASKLCQNDRLASAEEKDIQLQIQSKNNEPQEKSQQGKQPKQTKKQIENSKQPNMFDQYLKLLKRKILKRKIILFLLNIILTLVAFTFCLFIIIQGNSSGNEEIETKIQQIFNIQFSLLTVGFIVLIGVLSAIFSIIIIKGKVIMLHCYWISCLLFLITFSVVSVSAFSIINMNCEQPSSYILQNLKSTNQQATNMLCSEVCPCSSTSSGVITYKRVQDCPDWNEVVYSQFFSSLQQTLKCSGWCSINAKSYYTFTTGQEVPDIQSYVSCFQSIQNKIQSDTSYFRVLSLIICSTLLAVIFYTNYYIFMEKQDQNRQSKKLKKKILQTQQIMNDQLKTSKRMLS